MRIIVNATDLEVDEGTSVSSLLARLGKPTSHVAVEHNGEIVDCAEFDRIVLKPEDRLEVVHFVGGG